MPARLCGCPIIDKPSSAPKRHSDRMLRSTPALWGDRLSEKRQKPGRCQHPSTVLDLAATALPAGISASSSHALITDNKQGCDAHSSIPYIRAALSNKRMGREGVQREGKEARGEGQTGKGRVMGLPLGFALDKPVMHSA